MPHSNPARLMNARGPMRSIIHPETGIEKVPSAMYSVNAHCTCDSFHPVSFTIGVTNKVHAYCMFPFITIAVTAALNRTQRFTRNLLQRGYCA